MTLRSLVRRVLLGFIAIAALSCGVKLSDPDDLKFDLPEARVHDILHGLFPMLSDDELERYAERLDVGAAVALKAEIDDIRGVAEKLSDALKDLAKSSAERRRETLASRNDGFPTALEPLGRIAYYDEESGQARIELSGILRDRDALTLAAADVSVSVEGSVRAATVTCAPDRSADIVLLVDITGSMSSVMSAVRRSLGAFVRAIVERRVSGTLSVVTFQDTVGVNVGFQERAPANGVERSPFFNPVDIDDEDGIIALSRFIARLEANSGADAPENLAAAIDFARNGIIGLTAVGKPNVIDGVDDPPNVQPAFRLSGERQIFVAITDAPFHADSRTAANSSLKNPFKPRPIADILASLHATATTVHVCDPSWVDETTSPTGAAGEVKVDADYWAEHTGGLGEDRIEGYSLLDLDLLAVAEDSGLLDIALDRVLAGSCSVQFAVPELAAGARFEFELRVGDESFQLALEPIRGAWRL